MDPGFDSADATAAAFLNGMVRELNATAHRPASARVFRGTVLISDPVEIDLIAKAPERFIKNYSHMTALGRNRLFANAEDWTVRRDLTQGSYQAAGRSDLVAAIYATYFARLAACRSGDPADVFHALFAAALDIFHRALGVEADPEECAVLLVRLRSVVRRLQFHAWTGTRLAPLQAAYDNAREILDSLAASISANGDLRRLMARFSASAADLQGFDPMEEYLFNFFAAVETSVASTCWAIHRLAADAATEGRIAAEALAGDSNRRPADSPYLDCFVNETMRVFPAIPFVTREAAVDTWVGDTALRAGEHVIVSILGAHHHTQYWERPAVFDPARREFLDGSYDRRAFIPFLSGPRACGGVRLGRAEVREALRAFTRLFTITSAADAVGFDYALAMRPTNWDGVRISRR